MKKVKFNWAVFNTETGFRLTAYQTHTMAIWARGMILHDQPELRGKIECKQRSYESRGPKSDEERIMKKSWMVNSISHSPINGISGRLIGVYDSEKAAKAEVHARIETWRNLLENEGVEVDFDKMAAWFDYDPSDGCRWFITPIKTP